MHIVRNGIDVPDALVRAHEEGRVVFFCGAGISYESNLPDFEKLTRGVFSKVGEEFNAAENEAAKLQRWDAVLGSLENRMAGRPHVRRKLKEVLTPDTAKNNSVATHAAILELATTKDVNPRLQLVTTNFDRLFEPLINDRCTWAKRYAAPLLPTPRKGLWNGIVYLHGLLPEEDDELALSNLVVSSGDFGRAYLAEAWAARFVAELLRNYVVCFIGYSLGDQTVRYLMDAVDVYNRIGDKTEPVYMFTDAAKPDVLDQNESIIRIPYDRDANGGNHAVLHQTIQAWARRYKAGLDGKCELIRDLAKVNPVEIPDDGYIDQMMWALSDSEKDGSRTVRYFSTLEDCPNFGWLDIFEKKGFLEGSIFSLSGEVDQKGVWLCHWILRMMHTREVVLWVVKNQHKIWSRFFRNAEYRCNDAERNSGSAYLNLDEFARQLWRLIVIKRINHEGDEASQMHFDVTRWITSGEMDFLKFNRLREILKPTIIIRPLYDKVEKGPDGLFSGTLRKGIYFKIGYVGANAVGYLFKQICEKFKGRLYEVAVAAADSLEQTLDEYAYLIGGYSEELEISIDVPSVEEHWQNDRSIDGLLNIVAVIRDGWLELLERDRDRAREVALRWLRSKHFLFKRLGLFAAKMSDVIPEEEWLIVLTEWHGYVLWSSTVRRETSRLIIAKASKLSIKQLQSLTDALVKGFPACRMLLLALRTSRPVELADRAKFIWLSRLQLAIGKLPMNGLEELARIHAKYPSWQYVEDESNEFVGWGTWSGDPTEKKLRHDVSVPRDLPKLIEWLKRDSTRDDFDRRYEVDDFDRLCMDDQLIVIKAFEALADSGVWNIARIFMALRQWKSAKSAPSAIKYLISEFPRMPKDIFESIANQSAFWCEDVVKQNAISDEDLLSIGRILLDANYECDRAGLRFGSDGDRISDAINHPVGRIVTALIDKSFPDRVNKGIGIAEPYKSLFEIVSQSSKRSSIHGRLILASRAIAFYYADEEWTRHCILPNSSWEDEDEAISFWQGFLWQRSLHLPLLKEIKESFLATMSHCALLSDSAHSYISLFVSLAMLRLDEFPDSEIKGVFRSMNVVQLEDASKVVEDRMHNADKANEDVDRIWKENCWPVIQGLWPRDRNLLTPSICLHLTVALLYTNSILAEGIMDFWFLGNCANYYWLLNRCSESKNIRRWPREALEILYRSIEKAPKSYDGLNKCLELLVDADKAISNDPKYKHLSRMVEDEKD